MNYADNPITCQTFGVCLTVDDNNPAIAILMGEEAGVPTHGVMFDATGFAHFVQRCMALAVEINNITLELEGLEGEVCHSRLEEIQERYSAGLN